MVYKCHIMPHMFQKGLLCFSTVTWFNNNQIYMLIFHVRKCKLSNGYVHSKKKKRYLPANPGWMGMGFSWVKNINPDPYPGRPNPSTWLGWSTHGNPYLAPNKLKNLWLWNQFGDQIFMMLVLGIQRRMKRLVFLSLSLSRSCWMMLNMMNR